MEVVAASIRPGTGISAGRYSSPDIGPALAPIVVHIVAVWDYTTSRLIKVWDLY